MEVAVGGFGDMHPTTADQEAPRVIGRVRTTYLLAAPSVADSCWLLVIEQCPLFLTGRIAPVLFSGCG
jgi:hypothetical protein